MLEKNFKKRVQKSLEREGWMFIQLVANSGVPMGFPDTLCLSPDGYICFVEWKNSATAKRQPLQEYWVKELNSMGHDAFFVYPENEQKWKSQISLERIKNENFRNTE